MRMTRNTAAPAPGREENNEPAKPKQPQPPADPGAGLALIPAIQTIVPAEFFKPNGSDAVLAALEANVRALAADLDISTEAGRKAIASLAYRVACSKTPLDDLGEALIVESRAFVAQVNEGRKAVRERIDALKVEVRQPLTDWENADTARVDAHETAILALEERAAWVNDNWQRAPLDLLKDTLHANQVFTRDWQEFKKRGEFAHQQAAASLVDAIERREKYEADQAELKELRRQQAEREQKEREAEIARRAQEAERGRAEAAAAESRQAAEKERLRIEAERNEAAARAQQAEAERIRAEQAAETERQRLEQELADTARRAAEAAEAAEAERVRAADEARATAERVEREQLDAQERAAQQLLQAQQQAAREAEWAERRAAEALEQQRLDAQRAAAEAAERAEKDRQAAVEAERARVAAETEKARIEQAKREQNKRHRASIEAAAVEAIRLHLLIDMNVDPSKQLDLDLARAVVKAISEGLVPNVTINY